MPARRFKPTSPGRRFMTVSDFAEVTKKEPEKSLLEPVTKKGGRNNKGRITTRHRGGGHKRRYRVIDFKRTKDGVPAKVAAIEYDPNRSANIALLHYADGAKAYILAPARLRVGSTVESGPAADIKPGNALPLRNIPTGKHIGELPSQHPPDWWNISGPCSSLILRSMPAAASVTSTRVLSMDGVLSVVVCVRGRVSIRPLRGLLDQHARVKWEPERGRRAPASAGGRGSRYARDAGYSTSMRGPSGAAARPAEGRRAMLIE